MKTNKNRNLMLNFLKGIACIGVVFMHVTFPGLPGAIVSKVASFAVPLFLMIAGYYALGCTEEKIKHRLIKMVVIFMYGLGLFFVYNLLFHIKDGDCVQWLVRFLSIKNWIKLVVFCTIDFAIPLWYLVAMIETYILWMLVVKKHREDAFVKFMPALFLFQIVLTSTCETLDLAWFWKINFVTRALPWFLLGYYIHKNENSIVEKYKNTTLEIVAIAGCTVAVIPVVFGTYIDFSCVGLLFYSGALFLLGVKNPNKSLCKTVEYIGDNLSLYIYILHIPISRVLHFGVKKVLKGDGKVAAYQWIHPILTVICVIVFVWVFDMLIRKNRYNRTIKK